MREIWKLVVGYEKYYQINNKGIIKSFDRFVWNGHRDVLRKGRVLKPALNSSGYPQLVLSKGDGLFKSVAIHRIVAMAFVENPNNYPQVNHIDGDRTNNDLENLEWCTNAQNQQHAYDIGSRVGVNTGKFGADNKRSVVVYQMYINGGVFCKHVGFREAERKTGIDRASIARVCHGKQKTAGGYTWSLTV